MDRIPTELLGLLGEYRVCSELIKRGIFATMTYGNRKSVDVYAISDQSDRALRIEVKTTQKRAFVTGIGQKYSGDDSYPPAFWVLFQIQDGEEETFAERFFVLSHKEICEVQAARNQRYQDKYVARHGSVYDVSKGVDDLPVTDVEGFENQWLKIAERL